MDSLVGTFGRHVVVGGEFWAREVANGAIERVFLAKLRADVLRNGPVVRSIVVTVFSLTVGRVRISGWWLQIRRTREVVSNSQFGKLEAHLLYQLGILSR